MKLIHCRLFLTLFTLLIFSSLYAQEYLNQNSPGSQTSQEKNNFNTTLKDAQRGDPQAMGTLGLMFEKGLGCGQNLKEAFKWLNKGARKGDAAAENNLGFLYLKGLGVKEDDIEALKWFQKAADQGLASAQGNLGLMYGRGLGTKKDYAQALSWFKKAAEQDDTDAQVNLAQMLSLGEGTSKDYIESHKWFSLALKNHSLEDAKVSDLRNDIEWLEKRMTGEQIKEAKKRADEWVPAGATPTPQE
jgi:TPR repeat protein